MHKFQGTKPGRLSDALPAPRATRARCNTRGQSHLKGTAAGIVRHPPKDARRILNSISAPTTGFGTRPPTTGFATRAPTKGFGTRPPTKGIATRAPTKGLAAAMLQRRRMDRHSQSKPRATLATARSSMLHARSAAHDSIAFARRGSTRMELRIRQTTDRRTDKIAHGGSSDFNNDPRLGARIFSNPKTPSGGLNKQQVLERSPKKDSNGYRSQTMAMTATAAALENVRRTTTAHLDAVDALEQAVGAELVSSGMMRMKRLWINSPRPSSRATAKRSRTTARPLCGKLTRSSRATRRTRRAF
jgi:hypothetical protein